MEKKLIENLSLYSGLDEQTFNRELESLLKKYGSSSEQANLSLLREILAQEIQDLFLELKKATEDLPEADLRCVENYGIN